MRWTKARWDRTWVRACARVRARARGDAGMNTAEYAMGTAII
ncbi:DUF4244 domain-containing protein [Streptomyces sp. TRM64462]